MSKKILAFLLTAIMVLSCLPAWLFTVSAEGELTATFMDGDTVVSTVTFTAGSKVRAPEFSGIKAGYYMLNWSYNDGTRNRTVSPGSNSEALNADTVFTANWVARNAESPAYSEGETDGVYTWEYDFQKATAAADVLPVNGTTNFNGFSTNFCNSLVPKTKGFNLKSGRIWEDTITLKSDNEVIYTFRVHTTHGCWFDIYINGTKIVQVKGQKVNALSTLSIKVNPETGAVTYLDPTDIVYSGTDEIVPVSYLSPASTAPVSQDGTMNFKFVGGSGSNNYIAYFSAQQITSAEPVVEYTASFEGEKISGIDPIGSFNGFVTLPMPGTTRLGYDFGGWSDGTTTYAVGDSVKLTADTAFTAVWVENGEPKYYTASFGGDSVSIAPITTESGDLTLPAAPTKEGYRFVGWSNGTTTYKASASAKISADTTFTAVWEEIFYYTATFTNVVTAIDPITVDDATQITLPQATKKGYVLVGWSDGTNTYKAGTKLYLVGDTTFTAVWETFVPNPDVFTEGQVGDDYVWNYELLNAPVMSDCTPTYGEMNPYGFNATNGLNLRVGNTWIDNYTLVSTDPVYFNINIFLASKGGWINFHVNGQKLFEQKANESNVVVSVAITFDPLTGEVTWGGNSATVPTNDDGTVTLGVIGGNGSGNCLQSVNVSQKMSDNYLAFFKGDMVSASTKVAVDSKVTAPYAENLLGWRFLGWSDGTTTYPAGSEITLTKNTVFVAVWETAPIYTVGFAGDKIVGYPTVQTSDTVVMPEVPFRLGYDFGGWSSDGGVTTYDVGEIVGVTADTTFTAVWIATGAPTSYTATFTNVEKPIAPIVTEVGPIVLPGMPEKEGYAFSGWSDGVVTYPAGAKITLVGDTTFSAVWYEIDENIIYQNSFTDEAAMNESTFDSGNNAIEHGRLLIKGYWEKKVVLRNQTGLVTINFKINPNLQHHYEIFSINETPVLLSYTTPLDKVYLATKIDRGITFDSSEEPSTVYECYQGFNNVNYEADVTVTYNPVTGMAHVVFDYDCGEKGEFLLEGDVNVGPVESRNMVLKFGPVGDRTRIDDFVVRQADGESFGAGDVVDRQMYAEYIDTFDEPFEIIGGMASQAGRPEEYIIELEDGNKVFSFPAGGEAFYAFRRGNFVLPEDTTYSFDFMIPEFPAQPKDGDHVSVFSNNKQSGLDYLIVKYNATNGKWIAGVGNGDGGFRGTPSDKAIEDGVWYKVVVAYRGQSESAKLYIDGEYISDLSLKAYAPDSEENPIVTAKCASRTGVPNAATYYMDNFCISAVHDAEFIKVTGFQKSAVVDGKYNLRFVVALPCLYSGETLVGFEIESPTNGKSWDFTTTKVYRSLNANYGTDTITASSLGAQALTAVSIHGIPAEKTEIDLIIKPYVLIDGYKYYGSIISMNPQLGTAYTGEFEYNTLAPEQEGGLVVKEDGQLKGKKVVLLMGQSNMAGRGDVDSVEKIDNDHLWMYRPTGELGYSFIKLKEPIHYDKSSAGTSLGASFAKAYQETYGGDVVVLPVAVGATALESWLPGGGLFTDALIAARAAIAEGGEIVAVLWHQGESDNYASRSVYAVRLAAMMNELYENLRLDKTKVPFIAGEHFPNYSTTVDEYIFPGALAINDHLEILTYSKYDPNNPLNKKGAEADVVVGYEDIPLYGIADGECLRNIGDQTHIDGPSTRVFGYRYFNVYQELMKADLDGDGNIDYYEFVDPIVLAEEDRTPENIDAYLDTYLINK